MKLPGLLVVLLVAVFMSCNMFGPYGARDPESYGAEAVILEGKLKMRNADFTGALLMFDKAIEMDNSKSEAYFYRGKCMLRMVGVDITQVWGEINKKGSSSKEVPFLYPVTSEAAIARMTTRLDFNGLPVNVIDSVFLERKKVYDIICLAIRDLDTIIYNQHRMDGSVQRDQYESDYLVESSIKTVLGVIDMDRNDSLDFVSSANPGEEQKTFKILCRDLANLDSMNLDSLKYLSTDPNDLNQRLLDFAVMVGRSDTSYSNFQADLMAGAAQTTKINTNMASGIGQMLGNFKTIIPYYYYNDCADNDSNWFDTDADGSIDRTIWIDWDGDGFIDVDAPAGQSVHHYHIGDSAHRADFSQFYQVIDTPGADYSRYRYTGSHTHEFIFGDWGVDEEMMDGDDNTFDKLTDEDSRIVDDTLDDDGDAYIRSTGTKPLKMAWTDDNDNFLFDLSPLVPQAKIKSYLAIAAFYADSVLTIDPELRILTVSSFQGVPTGEFKSGDYGVDEETFDGLDNDGDGLIDEDVGIPIVPESRRSALIAALNDAANHAELHEYWSHIRGYWNSMRSK